MKPVVLLSAGLAVRINLILMIFFLSFYFKGRCKNKVREISRLEAYGGIQICQFPDRMYVFFKILNGPKRLNSKPFLTHSLSF